MPHAVSNNFLSASLSVFSLPLPLTWPSFPRISLQSVFLSHSSSLFRPVTRWVSHHVPPSIRLSMSSAFSFHLAVPLRCPHTSPCLFLNHMSFSFPVCPTLPPSVLPLCGEMNWCVSWVDHPSSCCLPTATLFPSCVAVFLAPLLPSPPACHSPCPSIFCHLSLYHVYSLLFLSHCIHSVSAPTLSFISLRDGPVRKIQPLVHKQSAVVLSACVMCARSARHVESTFVYVCVSDKERVRECLCLQDITQVWLWQFWERSKRCRTS